MHIAALASTAKRSHYSNYGPGVSLCAPSSNSHAYYRMTVKGLGITTATGETGGVTDDFGGTSSATPLVAGVAALTISANPRLSALEVISILKKTASKDLDFSGYPPTPPANFDPDTGWDVSPIAPFDNGEFIDNGDPEGTWSPWFGHGLVNAEATVTEALNRIQQTGDQTFQGSSSPDKSIPDNNVRGIKDKIVSQDDFAIASVKVGLAISHSYIGDLRVTLISPTGTSVVLHDRSGASSHNLHTEFNSHSVPALQAFLGELVTGAWVLQVQDLAPADRGRLKSWWLEIGGNVDSSVSIEESPGVIIPDNMLNGIERVLTVAETGQLDSIQVELDITHSYIGDLVVELIAPDDTSVLLHNRMGGWADNLIKNYTMMNSSGLPTLRGVPINGGWTLKVTDHAGTDQGKLNRWGLKIFSTA
jgi:subtilisin-like proprotein convertase family protein